MHDSARVETCTACNITLTRIYTSPMLVGTSVFTPEYNPGLGQVVYSQRHKEELCKKMGVVEIGNDYSSPEKIHKEVDKGIAERNEAGYQQALKEIL